MSSKFINLPKQLVNSRETFPSVSCLRFNHIFRPYQTQNGVDPKAKKKTRASKTDTTESAFPVITTSPSEDHTYSAGPTVPVLAPSSSPDEAYGEGSASEDSFQPSKVYVADWPIAVHLSSRPLIVGATDPEEQRKIAEGADALLNLAGITTRKRSHSGEFTVSPPVSVEVSEVSPTEIPKRTIATRGRKRGSSTTNTSSASTTSSRQKTLWPAAGRVGKRRGAGDLRRGGSGRRRGTHHNHNNNHIHLKPTKASASSSMQKIEHELRRPVRSEDKSGRTRR